MTSCLTFHGPQLVSGERDATCKQCWICSKAKAALVSQCEYSWVKSAVFYKSLLCLETVGFGIWGTRSRFLLPADRKQPADGLQTKLCTSVFPAAELDVELVSFFFERPCPNPSTPLMLHGSCQGKKAAHSGARRCLGGVTGAAA